MEIFISTLVGVAVALTAYRLAPIEGGYWADKAGDKNKVDDSVKLPFYRGVLAGFAPLVKYTPVGWMRSITRALYWAQFGGKWHGWAASEIMSLYAALGVTAFIFGFLFYDGVGWETLGATILVPYAAHRILLISPARNTEKQLRSELAEFVSMLAAEVGADVALPEAISRLSQSPSLVALWFRRVLSRATGRNLFTDRDNPEAKGALYEEAVESKNAGLIGLAINLDNIVKRGVGAQQLMEQTARSVSAEYIGEAQLRAEKVGGDMLIPMMIFFFLPYIIVLILILATPLIRGGLF